MTDHVVPDRETIMPDNTKIDELMKLADPLVLEGLRALEAQGVPWRTAMGSTTDVLLGLLNAIGRIVTLAPVVGHPATKGLPVNEAHKSCVSEVRTYIHVLNVMADIAEDVAAARIKEAAGGEPATAIEAPTPKPSPDYN